MDVSLEDLIQKKRSTKKGKFQGRFGSARLPQKNGAIKPKPRLRVGDARMKIIQQNRTKMVDARDKLAQLAKKTDARLKLQKLRKQSVDVPALGRRSQNVGNSRFTLLTSRTGQLSLSSKKDLMRRPIHLQRSIKNDFLPSALPMHRTILNQLSKEVTPLSRMPPLPDIQPVWEPSLYRDIAPIRKPEPMPRDLNMRITVKQDHIPPSHSIPMESDDDGDIHMISPRMPYPARTRPQQRMLSPRPLSSPRPLMSRSYSSREPLTSPGYYQPERQRMRNRDTIDLTDSIHSRLDVSPPPVRTMGILSSGGGSNRSSMNNRSRPRSQPQQQSSALNPQGYRIVVSNLQANVTQEDIKELFEDVGELLESRLVRPGTAEVIFKTLSDAQQAVEVYHNRQLDGQPMKCLLVNPRLGNKPTAPALKPASRMQHGGSSRKPSNLSKSSVEPDIETFHSVMFKRR